jgi:hypothetical protein
MERQHKGPKMISTADSQVSRRTALIILVGASLLSWAVIIGLAVLAFR